MPGYIKPVGGHMRVRFVQPAYDADDMATPPNKVIFDSDDIGTLSVIATGVHRFNRTSTTAATTQKIATWSLGFIPLCTFQFKPNGETYWRPALSPGGTGAQVRPQRITVDQTGISVTLLPFVSYIDIAWQAYRLAVTP